LTAVITRCAALCALVLAAPVRAAPAESLDALLELSIEDLSRLNVTSVSKRPEPLSTAAASLFVIRGADVRALGIRSLPEALRLAPNLQVARVGARGYAVSARGFKTTLSNKLLVLVDGRPIYTPLFSGVLWDAQDVMLEDLGRIEVISGPGASLWGTNAVNGVINIVTLPSADTRGALLAGYAGADERGTSARLGVPLGNQGALRVYGRKTSVDSPEAVAGGLTGDGWSQTQGGFRADWKLPDSSYRLQGDVHHGVSAPGLAGRINVDAYNVLGEWTRGSTWGGEWRAQAYVDVVDRADPLVFFDRLETADVTVQHAGKFGSHHLVWGGGYRHADDASRPGLFAQLLPANRSLHWAHVFVQDEVAIDATRALSAGLRLEHNAYTGLEVLPNVRGTWQAREDLLLWAAASRAVRSPARLDRDFRFPATEPFLIRGGPNFESEISHVAELGLRMMAGDAWSLSATAFHHWHDELRSGEPATDGGGGSFVVNGIEGRTYGIEAWASYRVTEVWDLSFGLLALRQRLEVTPGFNDPSGVREQGNDPEEQYLVRVNRRVGDDHQLSAMARHVGALPAPAIPSYTAVDLHWDWHPTRTLQLGLTVENLLDERHAEFQPANARPQSIYGRQVLLNARVEW
jgi:iron complex outermembrane recepter protein